MTQKAIVRMEEIRAAHAGFVKGGHIESTALSPQFVCF